MNEYVKQNFQPHTVLTAAKLNAMDTQVYDDSVSIGELKEDLADTVSKNLIGMSTTEYYPVIFTNGTKFTMSTSNCQPLEQSIVLDLFSANKEFVDNWTFSAGQTSRVCTSTKEASYIRWHDTPNIPLQVEYGSQATPYQEYFMPTKKLNEEIGSLDGRIGETDNKISTIGDMIKVNLEWSIGSLSSGVPSTNAARIKTDIFIKAKSGDVIKSDSSMVRFGVFIYDAENLDQYTDHVSLAAMDSYTFESDCIFRLYASHKNTSEEIGNIEDVARYITFERYEDVYNLKEYNQRSVPLVNRLDWEPGTINQNGFALSNHHGCRYRTRSLLFFPKGTVITTNKNIGDYRVSIALYSNGLLSSVTAFKSNGYMFSSDSYARLIIRKGTSDALIDADDMKDVVFITTTNKALLDSKILNPLNMAGNSVFRKDLIGFGEFIESFNVGSQGFGADFCFVDDDIWCFSSSDEDDDTNFVAFDVYEKVNETYTLKFGGHHNLGHVNSIEYCKGNDCLILGNGSGTYGTDGKIYIVPNVSEIESGYQIDITDPDKVVVIDCASYNLGSKFNVIWADANYGAYDLCYLIANDHADIYLLQLLKTGGKFDGRIVVVKHCVQTDCGYETCVQGATYHKGWLITGVGHDTGGAVIYKQKMLENGQCYRERLFNPKRNADGTIHNTNVSGLCAHNGVLYVAISGEVYAYNI